MRRRPRKEKTPAAEAARFDSPALLFDLDGTLIDSNYQHVAAWYEALRSTGIVIPAWKIHRRIGMSGESFLRELLRECSSGKRKPDLDQLERKHDAIFRRSIPRLAALPGANQLLAHLSQHGIQMAIATTGGRTQTFRLLQRLEISKEIQIVTGDDVEKAKPAPDIFVLASQRVHFPLADCIVVGDSPCDMLAAVRKGALGVGLLSGGYGQEDLEQAGAFRVYSDPADLLMHLEQLGLPGE